MATVTHSDLFNHADKLAEPDPAYVNNLFPLIGETNAVNCAEWVCNVCNISICTPTALLFVNANDADHPYIAHLPTMHPASPGTATPFDNFMVPLQGDTSDGVLPLCLEAATGVRIQDMRCKRVAVFATNLPAAPPVLMTGPHGNSVADNGSSKVGLTMWFHRG